MKDKKITVLCEENICPLCNNDNACSNVKLKADNREVTAENNESENTCWCMNPAIKFSDSLLKKVPTDAKKNCICRACALANQEW